MRYRSLGGRGLGAVGLGGRGIGQRAAGVGGGAGSSEPALITATDTAFFAASGCTAPTYGTATTPPALYVPSTNTYWFVWQGWDGSGRRVYCKTYNATTEAWSAMFFVGTDPLVDDDHGVPAIERDPDGYMTVKWGSHGGSALKSAHSTLPDDPSAWTADADIAIDSTYPKANVIGSTNWLFMRETVVPGSFGENPLVYVPVTYSAGTPTVGTKVTAIDFGASSRVYAGNFVKVGTDLHFAVTFADADDTFRRHIYYYVFNTLDESIRNFDSSVTVAKASFPISLATSNTSFRIVNQGTNVGNVPVLGFDTNDHPHVGYLDGPSGGPFVFKHTWHNGTAWQAADTVGSFADNDALHRFDTMAAVPLPDGEMDLYWITASPHGFTRDGDISKRTWSAGTLGAQTLVHAARSTYALGSLAVVRYAPTNANAIRIYYTEGTGDAENESGFLRLFARDDNGFIRRPFQTETNTLAAAMVPAPTDQHKEAIDEWYQWMKGHGLLSKMDLYYCYKAVTRQQGDLNWVNPALFSTLTDVGGGPTFTDNSHVAGNGTSQKINTLFTPSLHATKATINNCGIYVHVLNNVANSSYFDAGGATAAFVQINSRQASGAIRGAMNNATNNDFNVHATSVGRTSLERTASNLTTSIRDGVAGGTTAATVSTALADGPIHVCGTTAGWSARQIRRMSFGEAFTAAQRALQRTAEIRFDFAS